MYASTLGIASCDNANTTVFVGSLFFQPTFPQEETKQMKMGPRIHWTILISTLWRRFP
jgi:hypothetical protein